MHHRRWHPTWVALFAALMVGCAPPVGPVPDAASLSSVEILYPIGVRRDELRGRGSLGREFLRETAPTDEFAKITVWEMVSLRKPRPSSYERFELPGDKATRLTDYVFYDSQDRVIYVARRTLRS